MTTPTQVDFSQTAPPVRRNRLLPIAAILFVMLAGLLMGLRGLGRWLIREDSLAPAEAIVVLGGGMPGRAEEAAAIFRRNLAGEVWITRTWGPADDLAKLGIRYYGEEDYSSAVLVREGVPSAKIRILPNRSVDTEEEVREIVREMRAEGKPSVIIVTSLQHTRRVRTLWRELSGNGLRAAVRGAPQDPFDADHWWRNTHDLLSVTREVFGLLNAWAGLPVRPRPS